MLVRILFICAVLFQVCAAEAAFLSEDYKSRARAILDLVDSENLIATTDRNAELIAKAKNADGLEKLELQRRIANEYAYYNNRNELRRSTAEIINFAEKIGSTRYVLIGEILDAYSFSIGGDHAKAITLINEIEARAGEDWVVHVYSNLFRSVIAVRLGRFNKAYEELQTGLSLLPPDNADDFAPVLRYEFFEAMRFVEMKFGDAESAITVVEQALSQAQIAGVPRNGTTAAYAIAYAAAAAGDHGFATELFTRLDRLLKRNGVERVRLFVLREIAKQRFRLGDMESVISAYEEAQSIDAETAETLIEFRTLVARAEARAGRTEQAANELASLRAWVNAHPDIKGTELHIGLLLVESDIAAQLGRVDDVLAIERRYRDAWKDAVRAQYASGVKELRSVLEIELANTRASLAQAQRERELARQSARSKQLVALLAFVLLGGTIIVVAFQIRGAQRLKASRLEADAANNAKSEFLATMSHELRTPMNGVLGMAQALREEKLSAEAAEKVEIILDSGNSLMALLNDILDLSKIEAGRLDVRPLASDLESNVRSVVALWSPRAREKGFQISISVMRNLPVLKFDPLRVRQCVANLISNAVKFTETGGVAVAVTATPLSDGRYDVKIKISDTGRGIARDALSNLFTPFTQEDETIAHKFGGTGLGLSITRRLAQLMDGDVVAESTLGVGSTFTLSFTADSCAPADSELSSDVAYLSDRIIGLKTLVVDDNLVNRLVLEQFLGKWDHHVTCAEDGAAALELLQTRDFDLVLMDLHMPVMDGVAATSKIRSSSASYKDIPIIALTADAMNGDSQKCFEAGMNGYVTKPIELTNLQRAIEDALEQGDSLRAKVEAV